MDFFFTIDTIRSNQCKKVTGKKLLKKPGNKNFVRKVTFF